MEIDGSPEQLSLNIWAPFIGHNLESFAGSCINEDRAKKDCGRLAEGT